MANETPFVSIVPCDSALGQRLAKFTPFGLQQLCADFQRRFAVEAQITLCEDEPGVYGWLWLDFPYFEITFRPQRLSLLRGLDELAFNTGTPEPKQ